MPVVGPNLFWQNNASYFCFIVSVQGGNLSNVLDYVILALLQASSRVYTQDADLYPAPRAPVRHRQRYR